MLRRTLPVTAGGIGAGYFACIVMALGPSPRAQSATTAAAPVMSPSSCERLLQQAPTAAVGADTTLQSAAVVDVDGVA